MYNFKKIWITPRGYLFSNADLVKLIIPILVETFMLHLVGTCDNLMVASLGEVATSGVSVTRNINNLLFTVYMALGVGGSLVAAKALGAKKPAVACAVARQQLQAVFVISLLISVIMICFSSKFLKMLYPKIADDVLHEGVTYLNIMCTTYSICAVRWSVAGLFRIMKKPNYSMICAVFANIINVSFNALFIYICKMGVAGAAWATVISLSFSCILMLVLISNKHHPIWFRFWEKPVFDWELLKKIIYFGVPHCIEQGIFQVGCILTVGIVVPYGKEQIAVYSIVMSVITTLVLMFGNAGGNLIPTVIGQTTGAGDETQSRYYVKKLLWLIYSGHILNVLIIVCCLPLIFMAYHKFTEVTMRMARVMLAFYFPVIIAVWPLSFSLGAMLRAMNDVKFVMYTSVGSMLAFRVGCGFLLSYWFHNGVYAIIFSMFSDWIIRTIFFLWRYLSNGWIKYYNMKSLKV